MAGDRASRWSASPERSMPRSLRLEQAALETCWSNMLEPGSPAHARTFAGDGRARRDDVQAALDAHVAALGPPHTLVLTGAEGSGKTTELAALVSRLRSASDAATSETSSDDGARDLPPDHDGARVADSPRSPTRSRAAPPFVLAHSFADQSFSQDVAHFLEKSCLALKRRFHIREPVPSDPASLPRAFAAFLEHAAMFRRVLVVVDAVESARVAPYASYAAAAVAGVDPRERAARDAGGFPADRRAHVAWLPQSPPLAVRFILAARDDRGDGDDRCLDASRTVVAAVVSRAPASTTVFEMPALTTPQIARILAGASPAPVGAAEAKSHGALDRGHHRGEVMAEAIRAKCATPGYARAAAPFAAEATSRTRHSAWVVAGADEEAEYRGEVAAETHELPKSVAAALANLSNAPGGVATRAFVDAEERFGADATSAVATCLACARFGLTRDELKAAATRRVHAQHARAEQHARARREEGADGAPLAEDSDSAEDLDSAEASARASKYARARASLDEGFDALFATFRPWLAPWCSRDAWAREMEPFDEDEDDVDQTRPPALAAAELENAAVQIPFTFRDAYARAAALERYAPPNAVDPIDGESVRRRLHADLAAHFLPLPDYLRLNLPRFDDGFSPRSRRRIRAGVWHAAAGGEHDAVARTLARRGVVAALCLPGARSDVAAAATDGIGAGIPRDATLLWASWEERARAWMDVTGDDLPEGDRGDLLEGSLLEGKSPSGSLPEGSTLTSAAGAPLMTRAAAREYDLGAIASSSRSFSGQMGECAGAALALSGMFSWLGAPDAAASLLARARRWFGPPKGRSGVTCALALAHARALVSRARETPTAGGGARVGARDVRRGGTVRQRRLRRSHGRVSPRVARRASTRVRRGDVRVVVLAGVALRARRDASRGHRRRRRRDDRNRRSDERGGGSSRRTRRGMARQGDGGVATRGARDGVAARRASARRRDGGRRDVRSRRRRRRRNATRTEGRRIRG